MPETLKLPSRMDLSAVQALVRDLSAADPAKGIVVDAGEVTHLGALCAQALISAARTASSAGGSFEIMNVNDRTAEQLAAMGLSAETVMEGAR